MPVVGRRNDDSVDAAVIENAAQVRVRGNLLAAVLERLCLALEKTFIDVTERRNSDVGNLLQTRDELMPATADAADSFRAAHSNHRDTNGIVGSDGARRGGGNGLPRHRQGDAGSHGSFQEVSARCRFHICAAVPGGGSRTRHIARDLRTLQFALSLLRKSYFEQEAMKPGAMRSVLQKPESHQWTVFYPGFIASCLAVTVQLNFVPTAKTNPVKGGAS